MKFFIDTANLDEIRAAQSLGVLDGVTTNPTLIAKELKPLTYDAFMNHIRKICELVDGPVSAEVTTLKADEMIAEGEALAAIHENVVVKCPVTIEGIKAIKHFSSVGIKTNATLVFSPNQALLAAKAGATFVSPFIGRLDDVSTDGIALIEQIVTIFHNYEIPTMVLAASIRHPVHVINCALLGADVATMPFKVIEQLIKHPLTDVGLQKFMDDAKALREKVAVP
ncbi:MAG: fructose-6-phosphate aldolase [Chloroherpetonaceae bacterium]|nr:fructose-6-phosphate aldolase [Chloroherpetonaceae bacterium]MCS7210743.1 fructose-6-phosphate aldolase [Chloroherpetonaceae bacterium]MDW8020145.1 fructose-6-phosphate aldolase [Chloroherpetonaceae bacterium]